MNETSRQVLDRYFRSLQGRRQKVGLQLVELWGELDQMIAERVKLDLELADLAATLGYAEAKVGHVETPNAVSRSSE